MSSRHTITLDDVGYVNWDDDPSVTTGYAIHERTLYLDGERLGRVISNKVEHSAFSPHFGPFTIVYEEG